jgi:WD repeat-containing protein 26
MWNQQSGIRKQTISRGKMVRSVAWLPSSEGESPPGQYIRRANFCVAFLSVEGSQVVEISLDGVIRETHELDRLDLQDVAVTPDEERMLGVAILLSTKGGLQPSLSKAEKRIVGASIYIFSSSK